MRKLLLLGLAAAGMGLIFSAPGTAGPAPDRMPAIALTEESPFAILMPRLPNLTLVGISTEPAHRSCCANGAGADEEAGCCCSKVLFVLQEKKNQDEKKQDEKKPAAKKKQDNKKKSTDDKKTDGKGKASQEAIQAGNEARKALVEQRTALMKDGVWNCCIQPGCIFCQTAADACPCESNLKQGRAVCPECWGGWQAGQGQVAGVNPARVPLPSRETLQKLYGMKAQKLGKGGGSEKD